MDTDDHVLALPHGRVELPAFLPDATHGSVRTVDSQDLEGAGVQALEMNVFHLMQRPGSSTIKSLGGLHRAFSWHSPILTDSGGFQAYSLIRQNPRLGSLSDRGIVFRPEGSARKLILTPEKSIQLQMSYGGDIVVCLDDCTHADAPYETQREAVERTVRWARRCRDTAALKELEAARAGAAPAMRRDHSMLDVASEPEPEPTEDQGPPMLVGSLNGIIRMPRRGNPRDAYSTFVRVLLPRLQGLASLRKASARGTFVKGSKTVELDEGAWFATVAPGDLVRVLPAGQWQEVEEVASETRIVLAEPFPEEDGEGLCVFSAVAPTAFDDETLEFGVRFAVPKTPPAGLPVLSPGGSRP